MIIAIVLGLAVIVVLAAALLYVNRSRRNITDKNTTDTLIRDRRRDPGDAMTGSVLAAGAVGVGMYDRDDDEDGDSPVVAEGDKDESDSSEGNSSDGGSGDGGGWFGGGSDGGGFDGGGGGFDGGGGGSF